MADQGRNALLNALVRKNVITTDQRSDILQWSKDGDSDAVIVGYVRGLSSSIRPVDISRATGMSVQEVNAASTRGRPPSDVLAGLGEGGDSKGSLDAYAEEQRSKYTGGGGGDKARLEERVALANAVITQAVNNGTLSAEKADEMRTRIGTDDSGELRETLMESYFGEAYSQDRHAKVIDEVLNELRSDDEIVIDPEVARELDREDLERRRELVETPEGADPMYGADLGESRFDPSAGGISVSQLSPSTWEDSLRQGDFIGISETGQVERAPEAAHIGPGYFVDPTNGIVYSQAEIDKFRDDIIRATTEGVDPNVAGAAAQRIQDTINEPYYRKPDGSYGRAGRAVEVGGYNVDTGRYISGKPRLPAEDLQIPTLLSDKDYEIPLYDYQTGQAQFMWANMSAEERRSWTNDMTRYGSLDPAETIDPTDAFAMPQIEALERAMYESVYHQVGLRQAVILDGKAAIRDAAAQDRADAVARAFSIPASLREVPGDKTLSQEAKDRFSRVLGREVLDDELVGLVGELKGYYEESSQQKIALSLAAFNGDNQGLLTGAQLQQIEDPGAATSFDIEDRWASEIDLNKRRESNADSFSRVLNATMGGRVSVAQQTAAGGVTRIGRT